MHTWSVLSYNLVNRGGFHVVNDVIADSGNEMTIGKYFDLFLRTSQHLLRIMLFYLQGIYFVCKFLTKAFIFLFPIASIDPIPYQSPECLPIGI